MVVSQSDCLASWLETLSLQQYPLEVAPLLSPLLDYHECVEGKFGLFIIYFGNTGFWVWFAPTLVPPPSPLEVLSQALPWISGADGSGSQRQRHYKRGWHWRPEHCSPARGCTGGAGTRQPRFGTHNTCDKVACMSPTPFVIDTP